MAATNYYMGVTNGLDLIGGHTFWIATARDTAWPDDENPPAETIDTLEIPTEDLQAFKQADTVSMCVPDSGGSIIFKNSTYRLITTPPSSNAYDDLARYIYVKAILLYDDFPIVTFRQLGLYLDTQGTGGDILEYPGDVINVGYMVQYQNISPISRDANAKNILEFVVELLPTAT